MSCRCGPHVVPVDWCAASIVQDVSLYQGKGNEYECSNSRAISLLCADSKLYSRVLIKRIVDGTVCAIGEEQCKCMVGIAAGVCWEADVKSI